MSEISIITPVLGGREDVIWLEQAKKSPVDVEIIITDGSEGVANGRNRGIQKANSDKLVFLDDDSDPVSGYFRLASALLDEYAVVTGKVINTGADSIQAFVNHYNQGDKRKQSEILLGGNMCIRIEVFDSVGMFNEKLPYGHEEKELAERIKEEFEIWYIPDLIIEHPYANGVVDYCEKSYRYSREDIYYWAIRQENIEKNVLHELMRIPGFGNSTQQTAIQSAAYIASTIGYIQGYVMYKIGRDRGIS